jgi:hypothetical protein
MINREKYVKGGGSSMVRDFEILVGVLKGNYEIKSEWRNSET